MLKVRKLTLRFVVSVILIMTILLPVLAFGAAGLPATNLILHYDAAQDTYQTITSGANPPINYVGRPAVNDGEYVGAWFEQVNVNGTPPAQNNNLPLRPVLQTYRGFRVLRFDDFINNSLVAINAADAYSANVVGLDGDTWSWAMVFRVISANSIGTIVSTRISSVANDDVHLQMSGGNFNFEIVNGAGTRQTLSTPVVLGEFVIVSAVWDGAALPNGKYEVFVNGSSIGVLSDVQRTSALFARTRFANNNANTNPWGGDIAEYLAYSEPLTTSDRQAVEQYLLEKYILIASNPSPADKSYHVEASSVLSWDGPVSGVTSPTYNLYLGTDPNFAGPLATGLSTTSYNPGALSLGRTYYWRVDTVDSAKVYQGRVWRFTTAGMASEPSPADGAVSVTTDSILSWTGDSAAASYDVYVNDPNDPNLPPAFVANVSEPQYAGLGILRQFGQYVWRVDARNSSNQVIATGATWQFSTGGLLAHWKFDEGSGTTAADSAGTAYGTLVNNVSWTNGVLGKALYFDGSSYVDARDQDHLEGLPAMTLSCWVKPDGAQVSAARIFEHEDVFYYYMSSNRFRFENHAGTATQSTTSAVSGQWYHTVVTFYGTGQSVYVNGAFEASGGPSAMLTSIYPITIAGRRSAGGTASNLFKGTIDDVRIYSMALSNQAIKALYDNSSIAKYPVPGNGQINVPVNTVLSWTAGSNAVTHNLYFGTAIDASGIVNPAVVTGLAATNWDPPGDLELNKTYYWRIDEVDASSNVTQGNIWSFTTVPPKAYNPVPDNGATEIDVDADLSWTAGAGGTYKHDVYFGTDSAALVKVSSAQDETTYNPGKLDWATTYYWRIDERLDSQLFTGDLWSFTTIVPVCEPPIAGDANDDCIINLEDLAIVAGNWLKCNLIPVEACP